MKKYNNFFTEETNDYLSIKLFVENGTSIFVFATKSNRALLFREGRHLRCKKRKKRKRKHNRHDDEEEVNTTNMTTKKTEPRTKAGDDTLEKKI